MNREEGEFEAKDVFGSPQYEDGIITSSTSFVSLVAFPKGTNDYEHLRKDIIENLLVLQEKWSTSPFQLEFFTTGSFEVRECMVLQCCCVYVCALNKSAYFFPMPC